MHFSIRLPESKRLVDLTADVVYAGQPKPLDDSIVQLSLKGQASFDAFADVGDDLALLPQADVKLAFLPGEMRENGRISHVVTDVFYEGKAILSELERHPEIGGIIRSGPGHTMYTVTLQLVAVGAFFRTHRRRLGASVRETARRLKVSHAEAASWERGKKPVDAAAAAKLRRLVATKFDRAERRFFAQAIAAMATGPGRRLDSAPSPAIPKPARRYLIEERSAVVGAFQYIDGSGWTLLTLDPSGSDLEPGVTAESTVRQRAAATAKRQLRDWAEAERRKKR